MAPMVGRPSSHNRVERMQPRGFVKKDQDATSKKETNKQNKANVARPANQSHKMINSKFIDITIGICSTNRRKKNPKGYNKCVRG